MSRDSRGIGEEAMEELEPREEWPFENKDAVGEEMGMEDAEEQAAGAMQSEGYGFVFSMSI